MAKTLAYGNIKYSMDEDGHRLSQGQALREDEYEACPYCKEEITRAGDIDICDHCDVIVEGITIIQTWKQWDNQINC